MNQIYQSPLKSIDNLTVLIFTVIKFIYSEKATKFCEISAVNLSYVVMVKSTMEISQYFVAFSVHCKYLNARSECNDIVISVYSHYPLNSNAKSSDTK